MASPTLTWTIDAARGTVSFGRTIPFAGNTYSLEVSGGDAGEAYVAYLMDDAGRECLAKSETDEGGAATLALNTQGVWDAFVREPHEMRAFHVVVRGGGKSVAEGDLSVMWNPLWTDVETGSVYSMRGPKGDRGEKGTPGKDGTDGTDGTDGKSAYEIAVARGFVGTEAEWLKSLVGLPGALSEVQLVDAEGNKTDEFYEVLCKEVDGEKVLVLEQTKIDGVAAKSNAERAEVAAKNAAASEGNAAASEKSAAASEKSAAESEESAAASAKSAAASAKSAAASEESAAASKKSAAESASASKQSETNAAESASSAAESALLAASNLTFMGSAIFTVDSVTTKQTMTVAPEWANLNGEINNAQIVLLYHSSANRALTVVSGGKTYSRTPTLAGPCCLVFSGAFDNDYNLKFTITKASTGDPQQFVVLIFGY